MSDFEHIHSHRNLIGFDEHGVPTVTLQASQQHYDAYDSAPSEVLSEKGEQERQTFVQDYMNAVAAYRKTFPDTDEVLEKTPDPAVREMILRQKQLGVDTTFDRFDKQQPQCSFGLAGVCCRICHMGPCHISKKAEKGVCGADADLIVARNLLRAAAAGAAQHGMHGRELMLELKWAAEGKLKIPLLGKQKIRATAAAFGIPTEDRSIEEVAEEVASQLLSDLSNPDPEQEYRTLRCLAPPERVKIWEQLNLIPVSAYHEVFEAYHKSAVGTDGDWRSVMQQMLRCGLAFTFSGVVGTSVATDCLFGVGDRVTSKVNVGALEKGYVNIAVHGHYPLLVKEIVKTGQMPEMQELARAKGARGIRFYGICCRARRFLSSRPRHAEGSG